MTTPQPHHMAGSLVATIVVSSILVWFVMGTISLGLIRRHRPRWLYGDDDYVLGFLIVIFWPISLPMILLAILYGWIAGTNR